ncbi:MAG TPA: thiamine phosphate synthase [Verrucomicrobiae bacterium]|jgi:thiamine-phosphate pyrophosphorylase|nr:thiamine phosphate synthase [Verrucomicrobiae bacterium]
MKPLSECRLYTFVDLAFLRGRSPEWVAQELCEGGADIIQLRAKNSTPKEVRFIATAILPITRRADVGLIINDHLDVALDIGADGCHLGQEDFFDAGYSHVVQLKINSPTFRLGISTHTPVQAHRSLAAQPGYVAVGPVYATGTKPTAAPVTLDYVHWAARHIPIPWFAIGGINLKNLDKVLKAGAKRICVVSAILNETDISGVCQQFKDRLK